MAPRYQPGVECSARPIPEAKCALASEHSPARLFLSGHLAADCRSYQCDGRSEDADHLSRLDRRAEINGGPRSIKNEQVRSPYPLALQRPVRGMVVPSLGFSRQLLRSA